MKDILSKAIELYPPKEGDKSFNAQLRKAFIDGACYVLNADLKRMCPSIFEEKDNCNGTRRDQKA